MRKSGLANILCENELIVAQIVDEGNGLFKSLNITMGEVNVYDVIEAKPNARPRHRAATGAGDNLCIA